MSRVGSHASHEQYSPNTVLTHVQQTENAGFESAMCSDLFRPRGEDRGRSGSACSAFQPERDS